MSRTWKTLGGIALIAFGVLMLFSMMGARFARARAYHIRIAAAQVEAAQQAPSAEQSTTSAQSDSTDTRKQWHGHHGRPGFRSGYTHRGLSPFSFFGSLFKLGALGLIAYLILGFFGRHKKKDPEPVAKIIDDGVEGEIRVGDEIDNLDAVDPDEMTVDDLVRAMKRLGIKKLEL